MAEQIKTRMKNFQGYFLMIICETYFLHEKSFLSLSKCIDFCQKCVFSLVIDFFQKSRKMSDKHTQNITCYVSL